MLDMQVPNSPSTDGCLKALVKLLMGRSVFLCGMQWHNSGSTLQRDILPVPAGLQRHCQSAFRVLALSLQPVRLLPGCK